ncbi:MAG: hypothetical protein ACT4QC_11855 [Planctomycetaceae bacterium]
MSTDRKQPVEMLLTFWRQAACVCLVWCAGCDALTAITSDDEGAAPTPVDPFVAAAADAEPQEKPYIEASRPILTAVVNRDYAGLYGLMSNFALRKVDPFQFMPPLEESPVQQPPLKNLTQEKFVEWMQKVEQRYGPPLEIDYISVESVDPLVLSGRGDRFDVMMAIGAMPQDIPVEIRRASIRAQINCQFSDEAVKEIARDLKITEEQVRSGKWPENEYGYDSDERPYFKLKFVLIEDEGQLKVGYFEFLPPSMLD